MAPTVIFIPTSIYRMHLVRAAITMKKGLGLDNRDYLLTVLHNSCRTRFINKRDLEQSKKCFKNKCFYLFLVLVLYSAVIFISRPKQMEIYYELRSTGIDKNKIHVIIITFIYLLLTCAI